MLIGVTLILVHLLGKLQTKSFFFTKKWHQRFLKIFKNKFYSTFLDIKIHLHAHTQKVNMYRYRYKEFIRYIYVYEETQRKEFVHQFRQTSLRTKLVFIKKKLSTKISCFFFFYNRQTCNNRNTNFVSYIKKTFCLFITYHYF